MANSGLPWTWSHTGGNQRVWANTVWGLGDLGSNPGSITNLGEILQICGAQYTCLLIWRLNPALAFVFENLPCSSSSSLLTFCYFHSLLKRLRLLPNTNIPSSMAQYIPVSQGDWHSAEVEMRAKGFSRPLIQASLVPAMHSCPESLYLSNTTTTSCPQLTASQS